jgi:hypothetical protein
MGPEMVCKIHASEMTGEWTMLWAGSEYRTWLEADGGYRAGAGGCEWVGSWHWLPSGNLIIIEGRQADLSGQTQPWWPREVILERDGKGRVNRRHLRGQVIGGPSFELKRR